MPDKALPVQFIDTPDKLDAFCDESLKNEVIGVDTEFMWEKTYYPQACLIQVSNNTNIACIDPLALPDLSALKSLFENTDIIKIVHAGGQDMVLFDVLLGSRPAPLFDTQLAASFLDMGEQLSYARLIEALCHVTLEKSQSRTNWARRPLTSEQLCYAADDVRYLPVARIALLDQLNSSNKESWLEDENTSLSITTTNHRNNHDLLRYVKGTNSLQQQQLQVALSLAVWREDRAQQKDSPRRWVLADAVIMELSQQQPETEQQIKQLETMTPALLKHTASLLDVVAAAKDKSQSEGPIAITPLTGFQKNQVKRIQKIIREAAQQNTMSPSIIGSRRSIEKLLRGDLDQPLMTGWRKNLVGSTIRSILNETN